MQLEGKKISIKGFRNYKEEVAYNLGRKVKIFGDNGLGKSTIKEAICWAVLGTDSNGNERATTALVNNSKPKVTEVVLDFTMDEESHTIIRRKKGSTNEVYLDSCSTFSVNISFLGTVGRESCRFVLTPILSSMRKKIYDDE